jgi:general secretion pathway protein D
MRDQSTSNRVSLDRYDYIRGEQLNAQPPSSSILQINESPLLPPIRPEATSPTGVPPPLGDIKPPSPALVPSVPASAPAAASAPTN